MDKQRKILFVIPTLTNGGAERAMSNITTHLPEGVEADILLNSVSDKDYPTNANIITLGMKPVLKKSLFYQAIAAIKRITKLRQLKKTGNYDACISFMDSTNICNILSGNKYCKVIISIRIHLTKTDDFVYKHIVVPLDKLLYNEADKVVAVSKGIRDDLIHNLGVLDSKVVVITNGYDIQDIRQKCKEDVDFSGYEKYFNYIAVGRYNYQKGHWHLIRSFRRVVDEIGNKAHLIILGQGELKEYLQNIIKANNLQDNVTLMPYTNNPYPIISKCDVYVMPSLFEGYSNALCEALICGLPAVASDFRTSAREIMAPDTDYSYELREGIEETKYGWIVPVCSGKQYDGIEALEKGEMSLAEAMIHVFRNGLKVDQVNMDYVSFSIEEKVNQYLDII